MRFLVLLAAVALVAVVVILIYYSFTRDKSGGPSRWQTHTESSDGVTTVLVRRLTPSGRELGRQIIASIPDGDPDWETRYHEAMAQARSRVATLEIESD